MIGAGSATGVATMPRVLVVQDDPPARRLAAHILTKARYAVSEARSVEEARRAWKVCRPQVALVDLDLSGESGSVLLNEGWVRRRDTAVVVATRSGDLRLADQAFGQGALGCVVKPYRTNELLAQVGSALRHRRSGISPTSTIPEPGLDAGMGEWYSAIVGKEITRREREMLGYMADGLTLSAIASAMSISLNTARNHSQHVLVKLGAHTRLEAVLIATRKKLI